MVNAYICGDAKRVAEVSPRAQLNSLRWTAEGGIVERGVVGMASTWLEPIFAMAAADGLAELNGVTRGNECPGPPVVRGGKAILWPALRVE